MSAAGRLEANWLALNTESDMWVDMPWLAAAKQNVRQLARSFSVEGLLSLPYTLVADGIGGSDLINTLQNLRARGGTALFTLAPIEARMRAQFSQARATASGIKLRCVAVSVETGQLVEIDEAGFFFDFAFPAPAVPPGIAAAPPRDTIDGAIASSTMPGIFPARRIGNHTCVDGGVRDVVPVKTAVEHMGCNVVYAIRLSAPPAPMPLDPARTFPGVMARSVLELTYDEVGNDDTEPVRYGPGVTIHNIRSTVTLHDSLVIEPGLIRIAIDYGWMRAADAVDVDPAKRAMAMRLSDEITAAPRAELGADPPGGWRTHPRSLPQLRFVPAPGCAAGDAVSAPADPRPARRRRHSHELPGPAQPGVAAPQPRSAHTGVGRADEVVHAVGGHRLATAEPRSLRLVHQPPRHPPRRRRHPLRSDRARRPPRR